MADGRRTEAPPAAGQAAFHYEELMNCMRCGFCLPACPTYRETLQEKASPRGRIAQMKAVADGLLEPEYLKEQIDLCLGCRACEPACPAGVKYGILLEEARHLVAEGDAARRPVWQTWMRRFLFRFLLPHAPRLRLFFWLYRRSGLAPLLRWLLPRQMREMDASLPPAGLRSAPPVTRPSGAAKGRVALFTGCVMEMIFPGTNRNTARLLAAAGFEVTAPRAQTCCGALHAHAGDREYARRLALRNIKALADCDWVVQNAGGCGAHLRSLHHLFEPGTPEYGRAAALADRVRDISEFLAEQGDLSFRPLQPVTVTYQDSCHLRNGQQVSRQPRRLLRTLPGVEYVEMFEADRCCGSAGIYNIEQPEMADRLLAAKMEHLRATGATVLVTSNPGCLIQMRLGIRRAGLEGRVEAVHIADLLADCLNID
jgi:glycolate oxidase iron-sulfur subunit